MGRVIRTRFLCLAALSLLACTPRHRPGTATAAPPPAASTAATEAKPPTAPVATVTATPPPPAERPLLPALVGAEARRAEVRAVLAELVAALTGSDHDRVKNIPMVFDPDETEINAFAGCENGAPYMATTEGFMIAVEAVANTRATDEIYKTQTYDAYANALPAQLAKKGAAPTLPAGTIPSQYESDPKRQSRAREIYDDLVAFAFGHELAHHYLGHTGCANGQPPSPGPSPAMVGHLVTKVIPVLNQPVEIAADTAGCRNVLATGRARRPKFEWTEQGGLLLFDFFAKLESNAPLISKVAFLRSHPESRLRIPFVQAAAKQWREGNPG